MYVLPKIRYHVLHPYKTTDSDPTLGTGVGVKIVLHLAESWKAVSMMRVSKVKLSCYAMQAPRGKGVCL
jgi:hypothetical protein